MVRSLTKHVDAGLRLRSAHQPKSCPKVQRICAGLLNAIMGALDAHTTMSTRALNSEAVQLGIKDILINNAGLYETLRAKSAP
jgi:hypothetical protein